MQWWAVEKEGKFSARFNTAFSQNVTILEWLPASMAGQGGNLFFLP